MPAWIVILLIAYLIAGYFILKSKNLKLLFGNIVFTILVLVILYFTIGPGSYVQSKPSSFDSSEAKEKWLSLVSTVSPYDPTYPPDNRTPEEILQAILDSPTAPPNNRTATEILQSLIDSAP